MPVLDEENKLLLASGSPRRREMLELLQIPFSVYSPEVDESVISGEDPTDYVERVSRLKMEAARKHVNAEGACFRAILTADTTVAVDGRILGKPGDDDEALQMITALCGRKHQVQSCFCLCDLTTGQLRLRRVCTEVALRQANERELCAYVATGEGRDKAGAYAIQGRASTFVRAIDGSYSSVVGLPLCELVEELSALGLWDS